MPVDDAHAEALAYKASSAAALTSSSSTSIQDLYARALSDQTQHSQRQDEQYLALAPTFLSLHQQASSSKQLLTSLETFLSTFQSDLSTLSTHISALQNTSHAIDSRLDATRDVEIRLASFLTDIALSPRIVDLFFDTDPEARPDLWLKAVRQLERALDATNPTTLPTDTADVPAVREVRTVAEACRNVVASKLRSFLITPHAALRSSVTTNLQVIQTSVLLRHHRPLYAFLSRHMPRAAIDVQRSYVGAARLYFETAFRRYARSLGVARKRWSEGSSPSLITDALPSSSKAYAGTSISSMQSSMAALTKSVGSNAGTAPFYPTSTGKAGSASAGASDADTSSSDSWLFPSTRLQYARLESNAATVLGYLADDPTFKACPENLFRSLSLVLVDNVCSEYTFLARFFEGVGKDGSSPTGGKSSVSTPMHEVGPEESASITGDEMMEEPELDATPVQLSSAERKQLKGRGASEEIFKQIMEPSVSTWSSFTKSLLTPASAKGAAGLAATATSVVSAGGGGIASPSGYFSLLSMLQLNDAVLGLLESRGCANALVEGALMGFKIHAYPLVKKFLDDQVAALTALTSGTTPSATGGMWSVLNTFSSTSASVPPLTPTTAEVIVIRYTSLLTKTLWLLQDAPDQGILSSLQRLRAELAKTITTTKASPNWSQPDKVRTIKTLISAIEAVTQASALGTHPKVQNEYAFWNETLLTISA
ncbi:Vps52/Sac2 [Kalmanozyma brasiliensis GHG001]|uniref:Vps52/Sac2 n=1 Tax=Kalmanozyma brasiliensis (strain GHG001) TaxID=1365824 RepID=UPI002867E52A|nr:Vps52/Sac2 [Kalmanozyma brasiliensis GHG001]EST07522.2 Vps52/Sac2 [Kalmanozyma brasiliensis GHG001]